MVTYDRYAVRVNQNDRSGVWNLLVGGKRAKFEYGKDDSADRTSSRWKCTVHPLTHWCVYISVFPIKVQLGCNGCL